MSPNCVVTFRAILSNLNVSLKAFNLFGSLESTVMIFAHFTWVDVRVSEALWTSLSLLLFVILLN